MPARIRWSDLVPGLFCLAGLVAGVLAVLVFARVGALHGDKVTLYTATQEARGVFAGTTEVWLEGRRVGTVEGVRLASVQRDTTERLILRLEVLREFLPYFRGDSYTQIRNGGSLIGTPVVWVRSGTVAAPPVREGDTLRAERQGDTEAVASRAAVAAEVLPAIVSNMKRLAAQIDSGRGTAGAVLNDDEGVRQLGVLRTRAASLTSRAMRGRGTLSLALHDRASLLARARGAMARADSVRALVASPTSSLGRFRRDSSLLRTVADVRNEVSIVRALLQTADGTAGRALQDGVVFDELARVETSLAALMDDIKKHPLRYISF